ncbi:MAG: ankyrin repeat domain-containing protein, partial [Gammaproteobacteria bacterium]
MYFREAAKSDDPIARFILGIIENKKDVKQALMYKEQQNHIKLLDDPELKEYIAEKRTRQKEVFVRFLNELKTNSIIKISIINYYFTSAQLEELVQAIKKNTSVFEFNMGISIMQLNEVDKAYLRQRSIFSRAKQAASENNKALLLSLTEPTSELALTTGYTALHIAAMAGNMPLIEILVKEGFVITKKDKDGLIPKQLAESAGYSNCAQKLQELLDQQQLQQLILESKATQARRQQFSEREQKLQADLSRLFEADAYQCVDLLLPIYTSIISLRTLYNENRNHFANLLNSFDLLAPAALLTESSKNETSQKMIFIKPTSSLFTQLNKKIVQLEKVTRQLPSIDAQQLIEKLCEGYKNYRQRICQAKTLEERQILYRERCLMSGVN